MFLFDPNAPVGGELQGDELLQWLRLFAALSRWKVDVC
jgi:hypothetical protein